MWKYTFEAPVGRRCFKQGDSITMLGDDRLWYSGRSKMWKKSPIGGGVTSHLFCKTFRSFKSHLRRHPELQGHTIMFLSSYEGCNITANYDRLVDVNIVSS